MPARSLRIIFSATFEVVRRLRGIERASDSCPALARSLWQVTQYCLTSAFCSATPKTAAHLAAP